MASEQSAAVRAMYERWTADRLNGRPMDPESWGDLTAEPRGVDYVETTEPGTPAMWLLPHGAASDRVLLCMHGGGFVAGSIYTHRKLYAHLAKAVGARALLFQYPFAPEHVHPAQVDTATSVYRWLLGSFTADHIAFAGDSAGGGLTITTQLNARAAGLPLPAAVMAISPWVDMEVSGESFRANALTDGYFYQDLVDALAANFLGPDGHRRDPLAGPLHADLTGLAPLFVQVGAHETLLTEGRRLAERAKDAGVEVRLDVFAEQVHTFQMAAGRSPEADDAIARFASWARPRLGVA
ncbi:esterase [Saccharothrix sp. NRRL B-16348]|uniref:alpha/beta hydrolase n=1 Tax=Saccharothrix sp. NRRL B-16348 TaxID=1415542 RepID=UPI0006ADF544|nr:alpha/beta hydrolase [Saccharothrix sp. NRRL B-16348]KOX22645.1 esterase [Saccharothrix sp. NRRL B-16348]